MSNPSEIFHLFSSVSIILEALHFSTMDLCSCPRLLLVFQNCLQTGEIVFLVLLLSDRSIFSKSIISKIKSVYSVLLGHRGEIGEFVSGSLLGSQVRSPLVLLRGIVWLSLTLFLTDYKRTERDRYIGLWVRKTPSSGSRVALKVVI